MKRRLIGSVLGILLCVLVTGEALAAGAWNVYNVTVPKLGFSVTTNNITKISQADPGIVCSTSIGGGYTMNARMELVNNTVMSGYQNFGQFQRVTFNYASVPIGVQYHARFATNYSTPVNVQAQGKWSPDNPGGC